MYKNVGKQIKTFANILCWVNIGIGTIISLFLCAAYSGLLDDVLGLFRYGGPLYSYSRLDVIYVVLLTVLGVGLSVFNGWLSGLLLYAFGELVDRAKSMDVNLRKTNE